MDNIKNKYYDYDDFTIKSNARGGGKGRQNKSECKINKAKLIYSSKHARTRIIATN